MAWRKAAGKGQQGAQMNNKNMTDTGVTMSVDDFIADLLERGLMKDVTLPPRPPVVGMAVTPVHLNLSALDIKGAFVAAQVHIYSRATLLYTYIPQPCAPCTLQPSDLMWRARCCGAGRRRLHDLRQLQAGREQEAGQRADDG